MAGGIDWFRWHHGSVTDPKFALVARRAGASLPDVLAVWAYLLEHASAAADRGTVGEIDAEAWDCLFGFPATETRTADILQALRARGLLDGDRVASWEKRQPKREDETAAERKRRQRERDHEAAMAAHVTSNASRDVTQQSGDVTREKADVTHGHDRGEESREEKNSPSLRSGEKTRKRVPCPGDVAEQVWSDWNELRRRKKAPVTETVVSGARSEAAKAGLTLEQFLAVWCRRGSQGLEAEWLKPHERGGHGPPAKSFAQMDSEAKAARVYEMTGGLLGRKPTDTIEVIDAITPKAIR